MMTSPASSGRPAPKRRTSVAVGPTERAATTSVQGRKASPVRTVP